jgi:Domain of unknown function (DUF1905)
MLYFPSKKALTMSGKITYSFSAIVWQHAGPGGWFFVTLPQELSTEIRELLRAEEEGWGRLKAIAQIGKTEWKTAIWFDSKNEAYLLPLKSDVRKKEKIELNQLIESIVIL